MLSHFLRVLFAGVTPFHEIVLVTLISTVCSVLMARFLRANIKEHHRPAFGIPLIVMVLCLLDTAGMGIRETVKGRFTQTQSYLAMFAFVYQYVLGNAAVFKKLSDEEWEEMHGTKRPTPPPLEAPGARLYRLAAWVYSRKTFERDFAPLLATMQEEMFAAFGAKQPGKARWVHFRGVAAFWGQVIQHLPLLQQLIAVGKALLPKLS